MSNLIPFSDIKAMADYFHKSNMWPGVKTLEQAVFLMCWCQAEGMHPAIAARDFHIINGKPTLKADAMLARFQAAGGKVEWHSYTDELVSATFFHPAGGSVTVKWDLEKAKKAELKSDVWRKYPAAMMRARCISEGIRTVFPGVLVGVYNEEEAVEMPIDENKAFDNAKRIEAVVDDPQRRLEDNARGLYSRIKNGSVSKAEGAELWNDLSSSAEIDGLQISDLMKEKFNELLGG